MFKASFGNLMFGEIAIYMLIFIIGVSEWPQIARTVRASVLAEKKKEYVDAAKVMASAPAGSCSGTFCPTPCRRFS